MAYKLSTATGAQAPSADVERPAVNPVDAGDPFADFRQHFGEDLYNQSRRIVEDALRSLTKQRAYFKEADIVRGVMRIAEKEVPVDVLEQQMFKEMIDALVHARPLVELGSTGYLSTPEMMEMEEKMIRLAGEQTDAHLLDEKVVREAISRKKGISDEQVLAVEAACLMPNRVTVIEGTAGAGKSFTMEAVKESYQSHGYDVMGVAISWSAAKVLGASAGLDNCRAMEGLTREMISARETGTEFFRGPTLVIVDEAGMVGTRYMSILLEETARSKYPVKVVLTGDSLQVNPVEAGNALEAIIDFYGTTRINIIRRQKQSTHRESVLRFSEKQAGLGLYALVQQEAVHFCPRKEDIFNAVTRDYVSYRLANPGKESLVLALSNKDVAELNRRIRSAYRKMGLIEAKEIEIDVTDGNANWKAKFSVGDEVVVRSNDKDLRVYQIDPDASTIDETEWNLQSVGVFNRNSGRVVGMRRATNPAGSWDLIVDMGGECPGRVILNTHRFKHPERRGLPVVHNFATTIYASQGQTVDQVFMIDDPMMQFRLAYVGMSRHRWDVQVYLNEEELHRRKDRALGKSDSLQARKIADSTGQSIEDLPIEIGRYSRSEMLQTVAMTWSKDDSNMTATVFEKRKRTVLEKKEDENRAILRPLKVQESAVDFLPEQFTRDPKVDIVKILGLPDPITESLLVTADVIDQNRQAAPAQNVPLRRRYMGMDAQKLAAELAAPAPAPSPQEGVFGNAMGWMLGHGHHRPEPKPLFPVAPPRPPIAPQPEVVMDPGHDEDRTWIESLLSKLARRPTVPVPFLPLPSPEGKVELETVRVMEEGKEKEVVRVKAFAFSGPPDPARDPSPELLAQTQGICWEAGRGGEPRILARNTTGAVVARYRLDGTCVVGEGQPPIWVNPRASAATPVYLVQGAKEWFRLHEDATSSGADPSTVPHLVWCGKDVDLSLVAPHMRGRPVSIAWSPDVPGQQEWAEELQQRLASRWNLAVDLVPSMASLEAAPEATVPEATVPEIALASSHAAPAHDEDDFASFASSLENQDFGFDDEAPSVPVEPVVIAPGKFRRR